MKTPRHFYEKSLHRSGVYSIKCIENGKIYIGSAANISLRWRAHYRHLVTSKHHCRYLQNAWNKYGPDAFGFAVVEFTPESELRAREQFHIDAIVRTARFNSTPTAGSLLGFKMNAASLEWMRVAHTGIRHSEETKAHLSKVKRGIAPRPAGWKMPESGKIKLRGPRKPLSPEHRARSIAILRAAHHGPQTETHRRKIFDAQRKLTDVQVETSRERYLSGKSMTAISEEMGCSRRVINSAIRGIGHYGDIGTPVTTTNRRVISDQQKAQISAFHRGRKRSVETRSRIGAYQKGRPKSETAKVRMREAWVRRKAAQ